MSSDAPYQLSQGLEVLRPKSGQAYPIPCDEWMLLKQKIAKATSEPWFFHTIGSLLLGAALSALLPIVAGAFQLPGQQRALDLTLGAFVVTTICGITCLFFANKERQVSRERASDVVAQMDLIEKRYERSST